MNPLNLHEINTKSPYQVSKSDKAGYYCFTTDHEVDYRVGFSIDDLISIGEVYQFDIININHKISPNDPKVKDTILSIIENFFTENSAALLYICETGDGKQAMRSRLFRYWANSVNEYSQKVIIVETEITDADGISNFAALIVPKANPLLSEIISEFTNTVKLLQDKP